MLLSTPGENEARQYSLILTHKGNVHSQKFVLREGEYTVSTDLNAMDHEMVYRFLSEEAYWSLGLDPETYRTSVRNSICFGIFRSGRQMGFARVVTDMSTFAYLCDVFIIKEARGRGLSKILVKAVVSHPDLQKARLFLLLTRDAHKLYENFGFGPVKNPERYMAKY